MKLSGDDDGTLVDSFYPNPKLDDEAVCLIEVSYERSEFCKLDPSHVMS